MKRLPIYISLLLLLTCAKEDNTSLIEGYQLQISQLNSKITEYSSQVSQLQSTVNSLNSQVNTIPGLEDTITSLNAQIGELEETIEALTSEVSVIPDLNDEITSLEETIASLNEQIEELEILVYKKNNPITIYKTSLQNDEWNNGWWDNLTMSTRYGGTSPAYFLRGFTYFDYEGDGDMDVFSHLNHDGNSWMTTPVEYGIHIKTENGWSYKKLKNQFNKFASRLTSADIDNDGDVDFIIFVADDPNLYGMGVGANVPGYPNNTGPSGGIYAYVQEEGEFIIREIVPYQDSAKEYIAGNQFYYHGGTLGDINNDGFIDIVSGTQRTKAWLNNGDGTFGSEIIIGRDGDFNQLFNCSHHLFDINQDGYMDLITGEAKDLRNDVRYFQTFTKEDYAIHTIIYYGKGSYPFYESEPDVLLEPQFSFVSDDLDKMFYETYDCMIDLSIVDFDDDGDYDIFTNTYKPILNHSDMSEVRKGHLISYYENVNNTFVEKTSSVFDEDEWFTSGCNSGFIKVYDIDNDGKKEILSEGGDCALNGEYYNAWKMTNGKFRKILIQNTDYQ